MVGSQLWPINAPIRLEPIAISLTATHSNPCEHTKCQTRVAGQHAPVNKQIRLEHIASAVSVLDIVSTFALCP